VDDRLIREDALGLREREPPLAGVALRGPPEGAQISQRRYYRIAYRLDNREQTVRIAAIRHAPSRTASTPMTRQPIARTDWSGVL
jgi:plasmid stabilization system protein ParE